MEIDFSYLFGDLVLATKYCIYGCLCLVGLYLLVCVIGCFFLYQDQKQRAIWEQQNRLQEERMERRIQNQLKKQNQLNCTTLQASEPLIISSFETSIFNDYVEVPYGDYSEVKDEKTDDANYVLLDDGRMVKD